MGATEKCPSGTGDGGERGLASKESRPACNGRPVMMRGNRQTWTPLSCRCKSHASPAGAAVVFSSLDLPHSNIRLLNSAMHR
jgi:hypothetical protein